MIIKCIGYNQQGEGIAKYNEKVFYIKGLIEGEEAEVKIIEEHPKWGKASIINIIKSSPNRVTPPLGWEYIGGYELMHMNNIEQKKFKVKKIQEDFRMNAKEKISLPKIFSGKKQLRYRNKITLHDGGFHKKGTNEVIILDDFLLSDIKPTTKEKGDVIFRQLDTLIIGQKNEKKYTSDQMLGKKFRVSLGAFYQINKEVARKAYEEINKFINKDQIVFDLYSGIGTISIIAADKAKHVYGVEKNKTSHKDALYNQKNNQVENISFKNLEVEKFLKQTQIKPDVVIVDPARRGLQKDVCKSILEIKPKTIIYLSCNPSTQAADYNRFKDAYKIAHMKAFDMFPQTYHVENLMILELKNMN